MRQRIRRLPPPVQPSDTAEAIARFTARVRRGPQPVAVAYVMVYGDGAIAHAHAGGPSGFQHQLAAGTALLHRRVLDGYER